MTRRFPDLNFGALEGGVGRACGLLSGLVSCWGKRNGEAVTLYDPAAIDREALSDLFDRFGGVGFKGRLKRSVDQPTELPGYAAWCIDPTMVEGRASEADLALLWNQQGEGHSRPICEALVFRL